MNVLQQRMIEDMQLRGLAARTQKVYVAAVEQLAKYYRKSPDEIGEEELRQYLLYLANEKVVSASTMTVALCGIKFLCQHALQREWHLLDLARAKQEKTLPAVLSVEEVARVLVCVHQPRYREFEFFVISKQPVQLPRWIRMGKWASKILVEAAAPLQAAEYTGSFTCTAPLNPLDVPGRLQTFDLISMPPVSLLVNARIEGPYYELPDGVKVPAGMRYTFPK